MIIIGADIVWRLQGALKGLNKLCSTTRSGVKIVREYITKESTSVMVSDYDSMDLDSITHCHISRWHHSLKM